MAVIQTETIVIPVNGDDAIAHLARPDDDQPHPGIVLVQEVWGIEPHVRELAQRLALEGFVVLVPDLFHGKIATEFEDARKIAMDTFNNMERALQECQGALDYLKALPYVQPKKLGIMGFCMGGRISYLMASRSADLGAVVPWYGGRYDPTPEDIAKIQAPILAFYGGRDQGIPLEQVQKIEGMLKTAGKDATIIVYPEAGHAFLNPTHGGSHDASAQDAWPKAVSFLKEHLQ
ncbi:MAG: dienelactone hydrolase family protein [Chloroflexi bacterium]|nr:dienelactone hydrolase family protein [Chloroflexota bacterium]